MKKLLIITYYWPPAGGGGVQRPAKFCKYLAPFGWEPLVLTVEGGNYPSRDESLLADVAGVEQVFTSPTREPHAVYRRLVGSPEFANQPASTPPQARKASRSLLAGDLIRLNLFVPDSRVGWRSPARRRALEIIRDHQPDAILTTAPPYTAHLVGLDLQRATGLPWIADFRDPWVEQADYNRAPRLPWVKSWNRHLEKRVLQQADAVVSVGGRLQQLLQDKVPERPDAVFTVIPNGYDADDVRAPQPAGGRFCLSYFGTLRSNRLFPALLKALRTLLDESSEWAEHFLFRLGGNITPEVRQALQDALPAHHLALEAYRPHEEVLTQFYEPQVLLLCIEDIPRSELILTGKLFDYLPTGNPILALGPVEGDAGAVLRETGAGSMLARDDQSGIHAFLSTAFDQWKAGRLQQAVRSAPAYERKHLAGQLAKTMEATLARTDRPS